MHTRMYALALEKARSGFTGRERELTTLLQLLEEDNNDGQRPLIVHVYGVAGIGKSSILDVFAARARSQGTRVVMIDCRAVAPTPQGFLSELSEALGEPLSTVEDAAERLSSMGERVVLALDTYEVFLLLDTWIRQV